MATPFTDHPNVSPGYDAVWGNRDGTPMWLPRVELDVKAFGAVGDGVADDTAAIQAALDVVNASPAGGVVTLGVGVFKITSTLTITNSRVVLRGVMRAGDFDTTSSQTGTTIRWGGTNGGGPMIQIVPPTNAPILTSGRLENITFNGSSGGGLVAATGWMLVNVFGWEFKNIELRAFSTVAIDTSSQAVSSGIKGVVRNVFDNVVIRLDSGVPNAIGMRLDAPDNAGNVNHNIFRAVHIHYYNGVGIQLINADTNWFHGITAHRLLNGTGIAVEFRGSNSSSSLTARYNTFVGLSQDFDTGTGHGGVIARGTSSYTFPSHDNFLLGITEGNSNPRPVVETGATLRYITDAGYYSGGVNRRADYLTATGFLSLGLEPVSNAVPTSGTIFANGVYLYKGEVVTNIVVAVATAGSGTAPTHIQVGLWSSAGTPVALAVSAEDAANARWTSTGWKEVPLTAPYTVPADGFYYPSFLKVGAFGTTDLQLITGAANPGSNIGGTSTGKRRAPTLATGVAVLSVVNDTGAYNGATSTPVIGVN